MQVNKATAVENKFIHEDLKGVDPDVPRNVVSTSHNALFKKKLNTTTITLSMV